MKRPLAILAFSLSGLLPVAAQAPAAAASKNAIQNGSFERVSQDTDSDMIWDGVNSRNLLAGIRRQTPVITESGRVAPLAMAVSVRAADLNGDGLTDIMMLDGVGYMRVYFNSGTPQEPKFTHNELVPVYLTRFNWHHHDTQTMHHSMKFGFAELARKGVPDLVLGDYGGTAYLIRNTGTSNNPEWKQPKTLSEIELATSKDKRLWANLLSPDMHDFDGDGRPDLLVGEGSYSANAIHLLLNEGSAGIPRFSLENRYFAAYGDGREQLVPAVVDYNGDGYPDLIVGDRTGKINVYLSEGQWKKGDELKRASEITFGTSRLSGCVAPAVGDFNGDGLFDIIVGKSNGTVAISFNTGTKEQPKFGNLVDIKGTDVWGLKDQRTAPGWTMDFGSRKGNLYGYTTVVTAEEDESIAPVPDGKYAFKAGYFTPLNKNIRYPAPLLIPPTNTGPVGTRFKPNEFASPFGGWHPHNAVTAGINTDANMVIVRNVMVRSNIRPGKNYTLRFKHRGQGIRKASWALYYGGYAEGKKAVVTSRGHRDAANVQRDYVWDYITNTSDFSTSPSWGSVSRNFNFRFTNRTELNSEEEFNRRHPDPVSRPVYHALLEIRALVNPGSGTFYLDEVELVEQ